MRLDLSLSLQSQGICKARSRPPESAAEVCGYVWSIAEEKAREEEARRIAEEKKRKALEKVKSTGLVALIIASHNIRTRMGENV